MVELNRQEKVVDTDDLYHSNLADDILEIRTFYERQWLARGLTIKYISWHLDSTTTLQEPDIEIEKDTYRSFSRGYLETDVRFSE